MKEWRRRKMQEDPEFLERERAKARERSRAKWEAMRNDPEYIEKERARKRQVQARRRADPEKLVKIKQKAAAFRAKPEQKQKQALRCKAWRENNRKMVAAYQKQWREKNLTAVRDYNEAYMQEYVKRDYVKQGIRKRGLQKYGLDVERFNEIWTSQQGKCAICEIVMLPRGRDGRSACVDHNHMTGEVRGLLCRECNHGIGNLKDDPRILMAAAKYLTEAGNYAQLRHQKHGVKPNG
jgi:hypothetical protein